MRVLKVHKNKRKTVKKKHAVKRTNRLNFLSRKYLRKYVPSRSLNSHLCPIKPSAHLQAKNFFTLIVKMLQINTKTNPTVKT